MKELTLKNLDGFGLEPKSRNSAIKFLFCWGILWGVSVPWGWAQQIRDFELLSDPYTNIHTIFVQTASIEDPFLENLFPLLRKKINVVMLVKDEEQLEELRRNFKKRFGKGRSGKIQIGFHNKERDYSRWTRDIFVSYYNQSTQSFGLLKTHGHPEENWVFEALLKKVPQTLTVRDIRENLDTGLLVEGGSIVSDERFVFISKKFEIDIEGKSRKNNKPEKIFGNLANKEVVVLPSDDYHVDRFLMPVGRTAFGENTILLADPIQLFEIIEALTDNEIEKAIKKIRKYGFAFKTLDFYQSEEGSWEAKYLNRFISKKNLKKFFRFAAETKIKLKKSLYVSELKKVEEILKNKDFTVIRVPVLNHFIVEDEFVKRGEKLDVDLKRKFFPLGFHYTNVIQDNHKKMRSVIIPRYGIDKLDAAVLEIFKSLKCFKKIHQINSVVEGTLGGGPRCRVQVLGYPVAPEPFKSLNQESIIFRLK